MKLTFLGTSAGESYPAIWCHCPHCEYARAHGGRNIRQNSCALLDEDTLLDMNAHCFSAALRFGADVTRVQTLLVTHEHQDHFYPQHLVWRGRAMDANGPREFTAPIKNIDEARAVMGGRMHPVPFLDIYGSELIEQAIAANPRIHMDGIEESNRMAFHRVTPKQPFETANGLNVLAVVSQHGTPGATYNYILTRGEKTLLYALDAGGYADDMWEVISQHRYDCVVMEGTFGHHAVDFGFHMNTRKNLKMLERFAPLWKGKPNLVLSHMAPHWTPPYDLYAPEMAAHGVTVAYDGLCIEI